MQTKNVPRAVRARGSAAACLFADTAANPKEADALLCGQMSAFNTAPCVCAYHECVIIRGQHVDGHLVHPLSENDEVALNELLQAGHTDESARYMLRKLARPIRGAVQKAGLCIIHYKPKDVTSKTAQDFVLKEKTTAFGRAQLGPTHDRCQKEFWRKNGACPPLRSLTEMASSPGRHEYPMPDGVVMHVVSKRKRGKSKNTNSGKGKGNRSACTPQTAVRDDRPVGARVMPRRGAATPEELQAETLARKSSLLTLALSYKTSSVLAAKIARGSDAFNLSGSVQASSDVTGSFAAGDSRVLQGTIRTKGLNITNQFAKLGVATDALSIFDAGINTGTFAYNCVKDGGFRSFGGCDISEDVYTALLLGRCLTDDVDCTGVASVSNFLHKNIHDVTAGEVDGTAVDGTNVLLYSFCTGTIIVHQLCGVACSCGRAILYINSTRPS